MHLSRAPLLLAFGLAAVLGTCTDSGRSSAQPAEAALHQIFAEVWHEAQQRSVLLRVREGLPLGRLDDLSVEGYRAYLEKAKGWLARLQQIELDSVAHSEWVSAKALRWDLEIAIESEPWFWHEGILTSYLSPLPGLRQVFQSIPLGASTGRAEYLSLLGQVVAFVEQIEIRARGQAERGIFVWRPNLETAVALVRSHRGSSAQGPFAVASARLEGIESENREVFLADVDSLLAEVVNPALESLAGYLESDDYAPHSPVGVGASALPDGEAWYRFAVKRSTTMNVTPEEVHAIGHQLVGQMEEAMTAIRAELEFDGTREEFHELLRTDERFFPKTPAEVGERILAAASDMEAMVDQYFEHWPAAPYDARRLDPDLEGSQTYGFYQPPTPEQPEGVYHFNGSKLDERSWLNLRAVSLHELIPGHHFHIARQAENEALPDFRRQTWHTAYTEGWGSYSTVLGLEAGIYDDDAYSRYGMYVLEVFLATRLVVDTGMNLLGWSLQEGRDFMREHTLESETQIATESLRYSADMPSQALAYQMGKRKFQQLRARATESLGESFDIRRFHAAVLEHGSLPMRVLEQHIDWWIEQETTR